MADGVISCAQEIKLSLARSCERARSLPRHARANNAMHPPKRAGGGLAHFVDFITTLLCFGVVVGANPPAPAGDRAPRWAALGET
jgi:hypothetical protein